MGKHTITLKSDLTDEEMIKLLEILIERFVEKMNLPPNETEALLNKRNEIARKIHYGVQGQPFQLEQLNDPEMQKKLAATLFTALLVGKNEKLLEKLEELKNKFKDGKILQPEDLKKILKPGELKEIFESLLQCKKELRQILQLTPKPPEKEKKAEEEDQLAKTIRNSDEDHLAQNLFGLLTLYSTGGLPAVVTYFMGNNAGIVDQNPEHGYAQIDQEDKINFLFGDPQGLEWDALERYLGQGILFPEDFAEESRLKMQYAQQLTPNG